jgi:hypothetical protein
MIRSQAENRGYWHPRYQSTKGTQTRTRRPRHGVLLGTDFRHAVEFSKSGRTRTRPSQASSLTDVPHYAGFQHPHRDSRPGGPPGPRGAARTIHDPRSAVDGGPAGVPVRPRLAARGEDGGLLERPRARAPPERSRKGGRGARPQMPRKPSIPTVRPGRRLISRTARSTPGMKEARS